LPKQISTDIFTRKDAVRYSLVLMKRIAERAVASDKQLRRLAKRASD
jgi:hypothetical protein